MLISLTVGKVDAGVAVLLTEDKRLIEFPSILLPPSISSGSIVDITVSRNHAKEAAEQASFSGLQSSIFSTYGHRSPLAPSLRLRNATQTSVVLEWDALELAAASLRSLSLYRNGVKIGVIPHALGMTSTKISGLAIDTDYTFHLVLRTSAGVYPSEKVRVRTHQMTDLRGITVTPGVLPAPLRESLTTAVARIGARIADTVRIDTTHFVCTEGRGREWERAVDTNIPVVRPEWIEGCEREGRIVGVRGYYLNADPRLRQVGPSVATPARRESQQSVTKGRSGGHGEADSTSRMAMTSSPGIPPTPPAKDRRSEPESTAATPAIGSSSATEAAEATEDESEEDSKTDAETNPEPELETEELEDDHTEQIEVSRLTTQQPRELVQSPFDSRLPEDGPLSIDEQRRRQLARKDDDAAAPSAEMERQISEAGESFSEVQL